MTKAPEMTKALHDYSIAEAGALLRSGMLGWFSLMLDSSRFEVFEAGLPCAQGKSVVNSLSLKNVSQIEANALGLLNSNGTPIASITTVMTGNGVRINETPFQNFRTMAQIPARNESAMASMPNVPKI